MLSKINFLSFLSTQNSEVTRHNEKIQKEITEARTTLEKKLAEGEHVWKEARKYVASKRRKIDAVKMQSTAAFGKDLIKFIGSLDELNKVQKPDTPQEFIVGADMTRKILLKALEKNGVKQLDPLNEKFDP